VRELFKKNFFRSNIDKRAMDILSKGIEENGITKEECRYLLRFDENSLESRITSAVADRVMRKRSGNSGVISAQLGIDFEPCEGNCKFCNFGKDHTKIVKLKMPLEDMEYKIKCLYEHEDIQSIFLMTTHKFDEENMLNAIKLVKAAAPKCEIGINIGDTTYEKFKEFKDAGVESIYHACRLNEGRDTDLKPEDRIRTIRNAAEAGLQVYTCVEPVGPEHTVEDVVNNFFIGVEEGCLQHAVMRRIAVPGTPLYPRGQISEIRMGQMCAVFSLAALQVKGFRYMMTHEPNQYGFVSGANNMAAECGCNPRDPKDETSEGRGWTMERCRRTLYDSGFTNLILGDGSRVKLDLDYLERTNSI